MGNVSHDPNRVNVLGVGISVLNLDNAVAALDLAIANGKRGYVCVTGVHGVIESQADPTLQLIHNNSLLTTPDGMPMVWMGRWAGHREMGRVYGPDLMRRIFEWSVPRGKTHFFYGGTTGVAQTLERDLPKQFPGLRVVGTYTPPFRPLDHREKSDLAEQVRQVHPDFFWVGLSTPKQERFMSEYINLLDTKVMLGVGAAFDFYAGKVNQAPRWIQRSGFEWLYRLCMEPRRLWKRYLRNNPLFLWKIAGQLLGLRHYPMNR